MNYQIHAIVAKKDSWIVKVTNSRKETHKVDIPFSEVKPHINTIEGDDYINDPIIVERLVRYIEAIKRERIV